MIYYSPDLLLQKLGVIEPKDIEIEAIAYFCGAIIKYRRLDGCAARIVGIGDKAIISVDECSRRGRQRFSAAHELGHWMNHRGTTFLQCQNSDIFSSNENRNPETIANYFASDLILPEFMFKPEATGVPLTFASAKDLAIKFDASLTATAIRLIKFGSYPGILTCYGSDGKRKWFCRTHDVPGCFYPLRELHHETQAFDILYKNVDKAQPVAVNAALWIEHNCSENYSIQEDSVRIGIGDGSVLSLLCWKDEAMLREFKDEENISNF